MNPELDTIDRDDVELRELFDLSPREPRWANVAGVVFVWAALLFAISMMALALLATARWAL